MGLRELPRHLRVDAVTRSAQLRLFDTRRRTFAPYQEWEDYLAGMFTDRVEDAHVVGARRLLSCPHGCGSAMRRVIAAWPVAAAVNLSNAGCNRRAWIGQAACCLAVGASASATKRAWWQMSDQQRTAANMIAEEVILLWEQTSQ